MDSCALSPTASLLTIETNDISLTTWAILVRLTTQISCNKYDPRVIHFQRGKMLMDQYLVRQATEQVRP